MKKNKTKKNRDTHQLVIGVRSEKAMFKEASAVFEQLDKKKHIDPVNRLYFPTAAYMWKQLSPQRLEALYALIQREPISIRKLAAELKRDYRAVHSDIQILLSLNLVQKQEDDLLFVPWKSILIELSQAAIA